MAHRTSGYRLLGDRVNRFPQGAPPSALLFRIFSLLFTDGEAALLARLPLRPFTAADASRAWKVGEAEAQRVLDGLAERALLLDGEHRGRRRYVFPPPMAGFFEFSLMRVRPDLDQHALAQLFYEYLNVEDDFVTELFGLRTQLGRALVCEPALGDEASRREHDIGSMAGDHPDGLELLDHDRATEIVRQATHRAVGLCYCRHKMQHLDRACEAPLELCLSLGFAAQSLARHGHARAIGAAEAVSLIEQSWDLGLVQFAENVRRQPKFICNCCGCCCDALLAHKRFAILHPVTTTGFLPTQDAGACGGCGRCAAACPVDAITIAANGPADGRPNAPPQPVFDEERCFGCGLCVRACLTGSLRLRRLPRRVLTPVTTAHRVVLQAIERGRLAELLFDRPTQTGSRTLAAVLGVILRLPPLKQALASQQLQSRFLARIVDTPAWRF